MEDTTEKLDDVDAAGLVQRALALADRVREVTLTRPESGPWFAMWRPVIAALIRLARTLGKLVMRLRVIAISDEVLEPIDDELRDEIAEELRDIADDFPDVAEVLFGLSYLDDAYAALKEDPTAKAAASALATASIALLDRFLDATVDIVMGERESPVRPERVIEALQRYEHVAQRLLDRWLNPEPTTEPHD